MMNLPQLMSACPNLMVVPVGDKPTGDPNFGGNPLEFYAERVGPDLFNLRQTRYRRQLQLGNEHPHDIIVVGFTAAGLREVIARYLPNSTCDLSSLADQPNKDSDEVPTTDP